MRKKGVYAFGNGGKKAVDSGFRGENCQLVTESKNYEGTVFSGIKVVGRTVGDLKKNKIALAKENKIRIIQFIARVRRTKERLTNAADADFWKAPDEKNVDAVLKIE